MSSSTIIRSVTATPASHRRRSAFVYVLGTLCAFWTIPGFAQFRDAIADAWLEESSPTQNHGGENRISVQGTAADSYRALFQYDLSGVAPNANVTRAEAWFRVTDDDPSGMPVNIYAVTDSWTEGGANWSNTAADFDPGTLYGSFVPDSNGWVQIDLTPLAQAWICGELPDYGLMLVPTAANPETRYTSREWNNQGQRPRLRLQTSGVNPCADTADHFVITHDTFGIYCLAETITVRVEDDLDNPMTSYAETVTLDTQSGRGTWTLVTGSGSFSDPTADDGLATYQWASGESEATFSLSYAQGAVPIDVDVYQSDDPALRDDDSEGALTFSANGFTLTAAPLTNPPPATIVPFDAVQTAAVPFDIYIAAYGQTANDPVCGIIESYTGNKNLEFWSSYQNPSTGTLNIDIDGVAIATSEGGAAIQAVTFTNGQAQTLAKYDDAGSMQVLVKDTTTVNAELPAGIRGATSAFVSRPATFSLSDIRNGAGTIVNPRAADASGSVFIAAGTDFRATVTALDAEGDPTPNYGQEVIPETVRLDVELVAPVGGASPAVAAATGFGAFAGGTATGLDFTWPEVGIMRLRPGIGDGDYLGAGDVSGNLSDDIGRFVPNHFALALNAPVLETQCTAGTFTYTGESFSYLIAPQITATAQALGGATTLNYTGSFFKMTTATLANRIYASSTGTLDTSGIPAASADPSVNETGPGIATLDFSAGTGLSFSRSAMEAPFDADISLSIDVLDDDGVGSPGNPALFGSAGGIAFSAGAEIRYGRVRFINGVSSELVDLPVPLLAEYYAGTGSGFVTNTADSCTTNVSLALTNFTENLSNGETCVLDNGAPGTSGAGCAAPAPIAQQFQTPPITGNFNLTLAAPGAGNTGSVQIDATVPTWLRFDWDAGTPGDENPSGQAAFGLYKGDSGQIYLREVY
ncbi:MAG: DNRLRE domain-containing protein [Gammaproteobacteria bacterium]|nr:DNRLRE domain-containing protein [Gammaproteobacteria bacterium]